MPLLSSFFAIYTDGHAPRADVAVPRGTELMLTQMDELVLPHDVSLFGPHASELQRYRPRAGYLLALLRETKGSAGTFFRSDPSPCPSPRLGRGNSSRSP